MTFQYYGPLDPSSCLYQPRIGMATNDGQEISNLSKFIEDACLDASHDGVRSYFTISGSRQSGKTSTLLDISQRIKAAGGYTCWLDFQRAYGATPGQSVTFTARQILRAIPELGASVTIPDKFENDGYEFDHWLWELPLPEGKPVVLLMEELGALPAESRKVLAGLLRGAFTNRNDTPWNKVVLVLFGGVELYEMVSIEVSPFRNICVNISLLDLDPGAALSLVAAGFGQAGSFDTARLEKLAQSIYAQASGHPYLTQYLGDKALDYYKKNKSLPIDIQSVLSKLRVENSEYFDYLYQSIQKYNLTEVTKSLLPKKAKFHPDKIAIHRLELLGVLGQKTEAGHPFRNKLIEHCLGKIISDWEQETETASADDPKQEMETQLVRETKIQELSEKLFKLPCMKTPESRRDLLIKSGIEKLYPELDIKGSPKEAIRTILDGLEAQTGLSNGSHPLGLFLTAVKSTLGPARKEIVELVDAFIAQYGLMESKKTVFVSYAWGGESERTVDELELAFAERGFNIVRDKKDLAYRGSLQEFEQRIGRGQCVVLVISDKYLRSEHCMYELVEIAENEQFCERVFPIVLKSANIYKPVGRLIYIKYWEKEIKKLNTAIKRVDSLVNLTGFTAALNKYGRIRARFDDLTSLLSDMNALTPEILADNGFETLISAIRAAQA